MVTGYKYINKSLAPTKWQGGTEHWNCNRMYYMGQHRELKYKGVSRKSTRRILSLELNAVIDEGHTAMGSIGLSMKF